MAAVQDSSFFFLNQLNFFKKISIRENYLPGDKHPFISRNTLKYRVNIIECILTVFLDFSFLCLTSLAWVKTVLSQKSMMLELNFDPGTLNIK